MGPEGKIKIKTSKVNNQDIEFNEKIKSFVESESPTPSSYGQSPFPSWIPRTSNNLQFTS